MLVSIIVPMYNVERYISKCLSSLINQTYTNIEILLIDDGSSDNSTQIVENMSYNRPYIKLIKQENSGVSKARNEGLKHANGKYIIFIDADDWIEQNYIELLVNTCEKGNLDFVFCDWFVHENDRLYTASINIDLEKQGNGENLFKHYLESRHGGAPWGKVYLKSIIDKYKIRFKDNLPYGEDYLFNLKYIAHINSYEYIDMPLIHYNCMQIGARAKIRYNYDELQLIIENEKKLIMNNYKNFKKEYEEIYFKNLIGVACLAIINIKNLDIRLKDTIKLINKIIKEFNVIQVFKENNISLNSFTLRERIILYLILTRNVYVLSIILKIV